MVKEENRQFLRRDRQREYGKLYILRIGHYNELSDTVIWRRCHLFRYYQTHLVSACQHATYRGDLVKRKSIVWKYPHAEYIKQFTIEEAEKLSRYMRCNFCFPAEDQNKFQKKKIYRTTRWWEEFIEQANTKTA